MNKFEQISWSEEEELSYKKAIDLMNNVKSKEDLDNAERILISLRNKYADCVEFRINLSKIYINKKEYDNAINELEYIISGNNKGLKSCTGDALERVEAISLHKIGTAHYFKKNYQDAKSYYLRSLDKLKDKPGLSEEFRAIFLNDLGSAFCKLNRFADAQDMFKQASDLAPNNVHLKYNLAESYYDQGLIDKAKEAYQSALAIIEKNLQKELNEEEKTKLELTKAKILINIGRIELIEGVYDAAEVSLKLAEYIYNSNAFSLEKISLIHRSHESENINSLHNNLGVLYFKQDSFNEAKKEFRQALNAKTKSARTYNNLANVYAKQNNKEMAIKLYEIALKYNPKLKSAKNNISILTKEQTSNWWSWWFGKRDGKFLFGCFLTLCLFLLIASVSSNI